jgi:hypothetical protein
MRFRSVVSLIAAPTVAIALAGAAAAAPVTVGDVSFDAKFQQQLTRTYGEREGAELSTSVKRALERSLADVNAPAPLRVDVQILDAKPNRPTFKQLTDKPGLSMQSIAIGGASLRASLRDASGAEVRSVSYSWYENDLRDVFAASTWTDANRAIRWFALQVKESASSASGSKSPAS